MNKFLMLLQNGFHPIVHEQPYAQKMRWLYFASFSHHHHMY